MTTRIVVKNLHKSFGSERVLEGLDLDVPEGSLTAILGPSGSGKTTLLRVLAGLERADRGRVVIGSDVVDDDEVHVPAEQRRLGYVPQEGSLFPHLSVEANVGFGLPRRERHGPRVAELLEMVGLSGLGRRYPHQLSGGQQQRVAVARALAVRPRAVLLDEPFASLDAQLRASVRSDVREILANAGTTAVLVTHDQDEALSVADFVAVIRQGRIAQCAPPSEVYGRPADSALARFVGAANLLEGEQVGTEVDTPLGRADASGLVTSVRRPVSVLVRPEQFEVIPLAPGEAASGGELGDSGRRPLGRVLSTSYHGHDCLVTVAPDVPGLGPIVVRTLGDPHLSEGATVALRIREPVLTWPMRTEADGEAEEPTTTDRT